ncbi:MAG: hypothetical protein GF344_01065 [Chitinivibrionales bacterium]|nr:hypothetical protein [Chitinivibrionales bacterium]
MKHKKLPKTVYHLLTRFTALTLITLLSTGCGPSLKRLDYVEDEHSPRVGECSVVFKRDVEIRPEKGTVIGTMRVSDTGFSTRCHENEVLDILRTEACEIGADVVILRKIRQPDVLSSCYRVTADFVRLTDSTYVDRVASDEDYAPERVEMRVQKRKAMQITLGVLGGVLGFVVGYLFL